MAKLGAASKLNTDRGFLGRLRDAGRRHADDWLAANFDLLGARSTIDLKYLSRIVGNNCGQARRIAAADQSMIPKSGYWFSEKIMLQQEVKAR